MPPAADASSVVKLTQTRDNHPKGAYLHKPILTFFLLGKVCFKGGVIPYCPDLTALATSL